MKSIKLAMTAALLAALASCGGSQAGPEEGYIGPSDIIVENGLMTPEVLLSLGRLSDPQLSPDGKYILYGVSYNSIEENRSCRNLFIIPVADDGSFGEKIQLTSDGKSLSSARWSPDGKYIYFLRQGQLWKAPFDGKSLGSRECISDVASGIDEYALSPDGNSLLYVSGVHSAVERPVDTDPLLDKANAYATEDLMYRHWDHWVETINHSFIAPLGEGKVTLENSVDILGGPEVMYELPNGPFGGITELSWSPDGKRIAYSCKKLSGKQYAFSTNTCIYLYDVETKETIAVTEKGGYDTTPVWSPDGSRLAWLSMARDGYEADQVRLMAADIEGMTATNIRNLTEFAADGEEFIYNAADPVWAPDGESIYFSCLAEGTQAICEVMVEEGRYFERGGRTCKIIYDVQDRAHDYNAPFGFLPDGTLLSSYCSMDFPTELVAVGFGREAVRISHENDRILSQLKSHDTEERWIKTVDGKDMLTWVLFPPEFDPAKTYPAIEICLGGPQGTLSQGWSYRWNYSLMAHQGYVVVLPNRRGTTAFGQDWCEEISGDYIGLNMQDYLSAARMIKDEAYIGKIAACGASYGGYSVYYLAGIHGDTYDCFIAHAGIFNEEHMYMTTEEMWFPNWDNGGIPLEYAYEEGVTGPSGDGITFGGIQQAGSPWSSKKEAVRHYANSPHKLVEKWHTPILCIHGGSDFRVPYDEGMAAFNAAQMMGVPSKLIVFPDENHWILQPQNALYWHRSYFEWLDRWTKN